MTENHNKKFNGKIGSFIVSLIILLAPLSVLATETFTYDANGNMISGFDKCYEYNDANRLKKVTDCSTNTIAEYWYDHTGRRLKKVEGGVTTYYPFPDYEERVYPDNSREISKYIYANGEIVARIDTDKNHNKKTYYYHNDHLGSTSVITDEKGDLVEKVKYFPFGKVILEGVESKYLFTGQEFDRETGLYYYKARYYDAELKRFTQPDPIIQDVYDPQNLNKYSYVENNPTTYTDPSGNFVFVPFAIAAGFGFLGYGGYYYAVQEDWIEPSFETFIAAGVGATLVGAAVAEVAGYGVAAGYAARGAQLEATSIASNAIGGSGNLPAVQENTPQFPGPGPSPLSLDTAAVSDTAYKYVTQDTYKSLTESGGAIGPDPGKYTYWTFDKYTTGKAVQEALQLKDTPVARLSVETSKFAGNTWIPIDEAGNLEPFCSQYPRLGAGGGSQFITDMGVLVEKSALIPPK